MKKLIVPFLVAMIIGSGMATVSFAVENTGEPSTNTIKGDLLKIDGEYYVVKDTSGKEVRLHVDKTSRLEGAFKAGDKIEAEVKAGHAASIKQVIPKM